jgi:hypothetical protein
VTALPVHIRGTEWRVSLGDDDPHSAGARPVGPACTERVARGVCKWLNAGGLADLTPSGPVVEVAKLLADVDEAVDKGRGAIGTVLGLLRGQR